MKHDSPSTRNGSQLNIILTLYVILRLTILLFYVQEGPFNVYTDYYFYYWIAQLSEEGYLPFINMWYEYPPVLAYLAQFAYWLANGLLPMGDIESMGYQLFAWLLGMMLLCFDAGVLVLLHAIGVRLWGMAKANWIGWVYSGLSLPLFFLTYVHQVVALFFMLLAVHWFLRQRLWPSASALALGFASKITPVILLAPIVRFLWPNRRAILQYSLAAVLVIGLVFMPFVALGGGKWVLGSFRALSNVGSYGTVWAMLDGNWGPGTYGQLENRLQLELADLTQSNPAVIPGFLSTLLFAALYGWLFLKPMDRDDPRQFIWFATLTMLVFHLWSRGWSPHWAMMLIPLFLLSFPDRRGLLWVLLLTGTVFIEWPFLVTSGSRLIAGAFILLRTGLFVGFSVYLFKSLQNERKIPVVIE